MTARRKTAPARRRAKTVRKSARRGAVRKSAPKKAPRKKAARKAAPRKATASAETSLDALARKIVRATQDPKLFKIDELYTPDCVSVEATGDAARGHDGIARKLEQWESMQKGMRSRVRNLLVGRNRIMIEWDVDVTMNDGRVVKLNEVAVHEIKGGKIASERYYYNPAALGPPQA